MTFRPNPQGLAELLRGPDGPVARRVLEVGAILQPLARQQAGRDSGELQDTMVVQPGADGRGPFARVGSAAQHARLHHDGTEPHTIVPRTAKVLRFPTGKGSTVYVYARRVEHPGTRPNRFLTDPARRLGLRVVEM